MRAPVAAAQLEPASAPFIEERLGLDPHVSARDTAWQQRERRMTETPTLPAGSAQLGPACYIVHWMEGSSAGGDAGLG